MSADVKTILNLTVPVIVQIGSRKLPMGEILTLGPGAIIELPKSADEDLNLRVNNKTVGHGVAVKVGENFGIRIGDIHPARDRAAAVLGE
ncbi:MAG: FliM/FliN family flagellar motor switch protein [Planctomycetota bacterium]